MPHRLDFMKSLKVNGKSLKAYWKSQYDESISVNHDVLVSLLSSENKSFSPTIRFTNSASRRSGGDSSAIRLFLRKDAGNY